MKRFSANYIFPITNTPIKNGIVETDDKGTILRIYPMGSEISDTEFYNGIIVPGFINTHSHLELAYLKDKLHPKTLPDFIDQIITYYRTQQEDVRWKIEKSREADQLMYKNGIVAVGDISNHEYTAEIKAHSGILYHTFIEILDDFNYKKGDEQLQKYFQLKKKFKRSSVACHAPYSCSLFYVRKLVSLLEASDIFSIHMQESEHENDFIGYAKGAYIDLYRKFNITFDAALLKPTGRTSLYSYLPVMPRDKNVLFVHNVITTEQEVEAVAEYSDRIYFSFCPKSNMYIQNRVPDFTRFKKVWNRCTIGTDSLASNTTLNILEEMKLINIPFEEKLKWATINGAKALNIADKYGSLEIGKRPGLNLITPFDFNRMDLLPNSKVFRLI